MWDYISFYLFTGDVTWYEVFDSWSWSRPLIFTYSRGYMVWCDWTSIQLITRNQSWLLITRIITVEITIDRWTPMDTWSHLEYLMKIKWQVLRDASASRATWQYLSTPSLIGQTGLNGDASHPRVSSKPLIEDQLSNLTVMPNLSLFILSLFIPFGHVSPWISSFLPLLDSFSYLRSVWNQYFVIREGRICCLNSKILFFKIQNGQP